jgi:hypothetical protein
MIPPATSWWSLHAMLVRFGKEKKTSAADRRADRKVDRYEQ